MDTSAFSTEPAWATSQWGTSFSKEMDSMASQSDLSNSDWQKFSIDEQPLSLWYKANASPFTYGANRKYSSGSYDNPIVGEPYVPWSAYTHSIISQDISEWQQLQHPEWNDWASGGGGYAGTVGTIYQGNQYTQQYLTPEIRNEVQWAAERHGVPVNFLLTILIQEGSADWERNKNPNYSIRPESGPLLSFVGIFENAAKYWGLDSLWEVGLNGGSEAIRRSAQIEMLASLMRKFYGHVRGESQTTGTASYPGASKDYGWANVAAYHFSGNPDLGNSFTDELGLDTNSYLGAAIMRWKFWDEQSGSDHSNFTSFDQRTGIASPQDMEWGPLAQYDSYLIDKAYETGASANMLKALLAYGHDTGNNWTAEQFDPIVDALAESYANTGSWERSIDVVTSSLGYSNSAPVMANWDELDEWGSRAYGDIEGEYGSSTLMTSMWGGVPMGAGGYEIGQEFGPTAFSRTKDWYDYAAQYGHEGHTGVDVTIPYGTELYSPVEGVVIRVNNTYFADESGASGPKGELRIELRNGDQLIMGHMSEINVPVGTVVAAGQFVGKVGTFNGEHIHVEYRIPDQTLPARYRIVDPRDYLGGAGVANQRRLTGLGHNVPFTFQNLMIQAASGKPIQAGASYTQGGAGQAWNRWLRTAAMGYDPDTKQEVDYGQLYNAPDSGGGYGGDGAQKPYTPI